MVGLHRAVLGGHRGAFDQRQQIALHALARHVGADPALAHADLVDLVEKHDAVVLDRPDRFLRQLIGVEQLVGFLVDEDVVGILHGDAPRLGAAAAELAENVADRDCAHLRAGHAGNVEQRHAAAGRLHFDIDLFVVELAGAQPFAKVLLGRRAAAGADQRIEHTLLGGLLRLRLHVLALALPRLGDGDLDQIADDLLDVAAHIADLGEFRRLDLEKRRAGELGEAARNLGLADAGRSYHQDVFRQHLLAQPLVELQPAPAVAQRDRDRALGVALADDKAVELGNDLAGGKIAHAGYAAGGSRLTRPAGNSRRNSRRNRCQPNPSASTNAPRITSVAKNTTGWLPARM